MILKNMKSFFITSTIGRKIAVGVTGIFLALFVFVHMVGNLFLFDSAEMYNRYAHTLVSNPFIIPIEVILTCIFIIHVLWALALALYNRRMKGSNVDSSTSLIYKTLWMQGVIIFLFVIFHLYTFKFGPHYTVEYLIQGEKVQMRDLFSLVAQVFKNHFYVLWYVFCLLILFFHLNHGLQASIRSLGFYHDRYNSLIANIGLIYALLVSIGFISQPIYFHFFYKGGFFGS